MASIGNRNRLLMNIGVWSSAIGIALSPKMGFFDQAESWRGISIAFLVIGLILSSVANVLRLRERGGLSILMIIAQLVITICGGALIIKYFIYNELHLGLFIGVLAGIILLLFVRKNEGAQ